MAKIKNDLGFWQRTSGVYTVAVIFSLAVKGIMELIRWYFPNAGL